MPHPQVVTIEDRGLGNNAYLVDLGDGRAMAVDTSRDLRTLSTTAASRGLRVAFAAETHLHADFLTGAVQLAASEGARVVASADGNREFDHHRMRDGDELELGGLRLRAMGTPGHTDEHLSFLLLDGDVPLGVFTGGSLLVGAVARTDLVDPSRTEELARAQYRSVQRLLELPDDVALWPTHGAGSFCAAPARADRTSTIGAERATNPLLSTSGEDAFVNQLLGSLGAFPAYFLRLGEVNRRGPALLPRRLGLVPLDPVAVAAAQSSGALILDVRPVRSFGARHPAGAWSIPLRPAFASWLGWLVPHDRPLIILRDSEQDLDELLWQAAKIGYDNLTGEIAGGLEAWARAGLPTATIPVVAAAHATGLRVIDVRQDAEFRSGHVPGAIGIQLGDLPSAASQLTDVPSVIMCGHGERAMSAASILAGQGFSQLNVLDGGPGDWTDATGTRPVKGP